MKRIPSPQERVFVYVRSLHNLSQRKLAKQLRINQSTLSRIESGLVEAQARHFRKLEELTGQPLAELMRQALMPTTKHVAQHLQRPERVPLEELPAKTLYALYCRASMRLWDLEKELARKQQELETLLDQELLVQGTTQVLEHRVATRAGILESAERHGLSEDSREFCGKVLAEAERALDVTQRTVYRCPHWQVEELYDELDELEARKERLEQRVSRLLEVYEVKKENVCEEGVEVDGSESAVAEVERERIVVPEAPVLAEQAVALEAPLGSRLQPGEVLRPEAGGLLVLGRSREGSGEDCEEVSGKLVDIRSGRGDAFEFEVACAVGFV